MLSYIKKYIEQKRLQEDEIAKRNKKAAKKAGRLDNLNRIKSRIYND